MCVLVCGCVSQVQFIPGKAVRKKLGAFVVLMGHFGLERPDHFPPHCAHAGPKTSFLFKFVTLMKHTTENGD